MGYRFGLHRGRDAQGLGAEGEREELGRLVVSGPIRLKWSRQGREVERWR